MKLLNSWLFDQKCWSDYNQGQDPTFGSQNGNLYSCCGTVNAKEPFRSFAEFTAHRDWVKRLLAILWQMNMGGWGLKRPPARA